LDDHANFPVRGLVVVRDLAESVHTGERHHAANAALIGVSCRGDRQFRFLGVLNHREQYRLGANVEDPLDNDRVVPRYPHHRLRIARLDNLQLQQDIDQIIRRMFHVDDDPVVAGMGQHLGNDGAAQPAPQSDLALALLDCAFEFVSSKFHGMWLSVLRV